MSAAINISCNLDICPMCKSNDPPLTDRRSSLSCLGCDTLFHKKCARNLHKLDNGAFSVCCDNSADRSILSPPTDDGCDIDLENLPSSINLSSSDLNKIIQNAASKAARETIKTFSASIDSINNRIKTLDSKSTQLEEIYKNLSLKIQEAESVISASFENNCDLMYAEFSDRDFRKFNLLMHNLPEENNVNLHKQVTDILKNIASFDLTSTKISRLDKFKPSHIRPVRITFPNRDNIFDILNNSEKWQWNLTFSTDRTIMQRNILKKYS